MQTPSTIPVAERDGARTGPRGSGGNARQARRRLRAVMTAALLATALIAAGACSAGETSTPAAACISPGVEPDAIELGVLYPDSGSFSTTFRGFRDGLAARLEIENSRGGVHGREITYTRADDRANTETNLTEAIRLVEKEQVFAVIEGSVAEAGSAHYLDAQGVPVTGLGPSAVWNNHRNMFTWSSLVSQTAVTTAWGQIARQQGGTRAAVLAVVNVPSSQELATTLSASMRWAGIPTVYTNLRLYSLSNVDRMAEAIVAAQADVVTGVVTPEIWGELASALREAGARIAVPLFPNGYDRASLISTGPVLAGMYIGQVTAPFELGLPAHQEYFNALTQYAPEITVQENQLALNGWLAADLMLRGLKEAGPCPSRAGFIDALRSVRHYDGGGLVRPAIDLSTYTLPSACLNVVQVDPTGQSYQLVGDGPVCGQIQTVS
ncbi:ABC-type branched-chain amino acid transport system, substrate-binding protein [Parafrankia irregularis]|uniref:ABC-type branched-chain amino acid transport system, substrate-binding protein n=1 Tax=Parafrankia irregularis TaxID=795642 RepID=A0A0S4QVQ8_9ACTN|nr:MULTISPECIES: ABC transporter substrate-binding protein [Parafrankia]MBE3200359.1 ABC transporter substrate-binding protein [Parafrankia sp. CH37]CUU59787.1 ABC-type branched-chain amino acid transport system, substrate-binding protein [Parafrankia irregularis]